MGSASSSPMSSRWIFFLLGGLLVGMCFLLGISLFLLFSWRTRNTASPPTSMPMMQNTPLLETSEAITPTPSRKLTLPAATPTPAVSWAPITLENITSLQQVQQLTVKGRVTRVQLSPTGKYILIGLNQETTESAWLELYHVPTGNRLLRVDGQPPAAFAPDEQRVAIGSRLWRLQGPDIQEASTATTGEPQDLAFTPQGQPVGLFAQGQGVFAIALDSGAQVYLEGSDAWSFYPFLLAPNAAYAVMDPFVPPYPEDPYQIWDTGSGVLLQIWQVEGIMPFLTFSPQGNYLSIARCTDADAELYCFASAIALLYLPNIRSMNLEGHTAYINAVAFSSNEQWLVSAASPYDGDQELYVWNLQAGQGRLLFASGDFPIDQVAITSDGRLVMFLATREGRLKFRSVPEGGDVFELPQAVDGFALNRDETLLVTWSLQQGDNSRIAFWSAR